MDAAEEFYGPWSVRVLDSRFPQRQHFEISGSDGSDGAYEATRDLTIDVTGERWTLTASVSKGGVWQPSALQRSNATFSSADGLIVTVGGDDNPPGTPDPNFDDMILVLEYKNPTVNPPEGWQNPYDFTIPLEIIEWD
jgi:hypothetical protein